MASVYEKLMQVQRNLKAPKNQFNSFGKYNYRSCEDILEGLKPHLIDSTVYVYDEVVQIGERYYVKATAVFQSGEESVQVTAYAREENEKKGMDASQITGMASSYARKYALNGLFLIDDTKDADTRDNSKSGGSESKPAPQDKKKPETLKDDITAEANTFASKCAEIAMSDAEITAFKRFLFKKSPTKAELRAVNDAFNDHFDRFIESKAA